jgi:predicted component of type VI protein secretion system
VSFAPRDRYISQHHCAIWTRGDQLLVRDLGSTNGTYLNDRAVTGEQQALNGDSLKIGPLLFDVCIEGSPSATQRTPLPPMRNSTQSADVEEEAAMLLLLGEDASAPTTQPVDFDPVPSGNTIMIHASPLVEKSTASQPDHSRPKETTSASSDTAVVANALLQKYLRRPRP